MNKYCLRFHRNAFFLKGLLLRGTQRMNEFVSGWFSLIKTLVKLSNEKLKSEIAFYGMISQSISLLEPLYK